MEMDDVICHGGYQPGIGTRIEISVSRSIHGDSETAGERAWG